MVSSILCIMSQVEHKKKCDSIDSESKSVKQNAEASKAKQIVWQMVEPVINVAFH